VLQAEHIEAIVSMYTAMLKTSSPHQQRRVVTDWASDVLCMWEKNIRKMSSQSLRSVTLLSRRNYFGLC